jgi:hypothetical protein
VYDGGAVKLDAGKTVMVPIVHQRGPERAAEDDGDRCGRDLGPRSDVRQEHCPHGARRSDGGDDDKSSTPHLDSARAELLQRREAHHPRRDAQQQPAAH